MEDLKKTAGKITSACMELINKLLTISGYRLYLHRIQQPMAPFALEEKHVKDCRVVTGRDKLLEYMPKNSICTEIGILKCDFSKEILKKIEPRELHLIDNSESAMQCAREELINEIDKAVFLHCGNSFDELNKFQDNYFDFIYIDAGHSYEFVKKDLEAARRKAKNGGFIILHDYNLFNHIEDLYFDVVPAVNEFCVNYDYEVAFFVLESTMWNSVALKKIQPSRKSMD